MNIKAGVIYLNLILSSCAGIHEEEFDVLPQDWKTRSSQQDVILAIGFDSEEEVSNNRLSKYPERIAFDTKVKASGEGALKVIIPGNTYADTSGSWRINFSKKPYTVQFGENQEFFVQWRQRFDSFLLEHNFQGAGGFKQVIIGEGDRLNRKEIGSCTDLEIVIDNGGFKGYPQIYHSCGHSWPYDAYRFVDYVAEEWMTFQVHIKLGASGTAIDSATGKEMHGFINSTIKMWVAREGVKSKLTHHETDLVLRTGYGDAKDARYGKVWLLPYMTGKDSKEKHQITYTWYDELIISTSRIADPK